MSVKGLARKLSLRKSQTKDSDSLTSPNAAQWSSSLGINHNSYSNPGSNVPYSPAIPQLQYPPQSLRPTHSQPALASSFSSYHHQPAATPLPQSFQVSSSSGVVPAIPTASQPPSSGWLYEDIVLERRGKGLGFTIAGGVDRNDTNDGSIFVAKIIEGGVADNDGRIMLNDTILSVSGTSFVGLTHKEAVEGLKSAPARVHLKVRRYEPPSDGILLIELVRPPNRGLGFMVAGGVGSQEVPDDDGIFVTKITEDGVAEQDGRLAVGDRILAVNDFSMTYVSHEEAVQVLMNARGRVRILVAQTDLNPRPFTTPVHQTRGLTTTFQNGFKSEMSYNGSYEAVGSPPIMVQSPPNRSNPAFVQPTQHNGKRLQPPPTIVQSPPIVQQPSYFSQPSFIPPNQYNTKLQVPPTVIQSPPVLQQSPPFGSQFSPTSMQSPPIRGNLQAPQIMELQSPPIAISSPLIRTMSAQPQLKPDFVPQTVTDSDIPSFVREQRQIIIRKSMNAGLGFNIVGGKDGFGIFVCSIVPGGAADRNGQLRKGDQLLSVNNVNLHQVTHQEAILSLKAVGETAVIVAQYRPEEFNRLERKLRDYGQQQQLKMMQVAMPEPTVQRKTMFIRALFDYDAPVDATQVAGRKLSFSFGDILHVVNAASSDEWWQARRVLPWSDVNSGSGLIPSKKRMYEMPATEASYPIHGIGMNPDNNNKENVPAKSRRKSFSLISKLHMMKSKDKAHEKADAHSDDTTSISPWGNVVPSSSYEVVSLIKCKIKRPIIIFGPLKDKINDDLVTDFPDRFGSCIPHTTRPIRRGEVDGRDYHFVLSRESMERDVRNGLFVEAGVYNDHMYGMSAESVRNVAAQGKHCLLDVSTGSIPRLHAVGIYPISILIKPKSPEIVSVWNHPISGEAARKVHGATVKLFQDHGQYFTAVVSADIPADVYGRVKQIIEDHSQPNVWVATNENLS